MIHYFIVFKIIATNKFFQLSKATEMFIIIRGKAIFTVGIQEKTVGGNGDPTTIFVPGNVPHQVKLFFFPIKYRFFKISNPFEETLVYFYCFPGGEFVDKDITYYFPDGSVKKPSTSWENR